MRDDKPTEVAIGGKFYELPVLNYRYIYKGPVPTASFTNQQHVRRDNIGECI